MTVPGVGFRGRGQGRAGGLMAPRGLDRKTLSGPALFMMTLSSAAPLTGVIGGLVAAYGFGVVAVPAACVVVMAGWGLFTVGYVAVSRHVPHAGPFYAQIARGLGPAWGVAGAAVALLAYNAIIFCLYGLLGATLAGFLGGSWWVWALVAWAAVAALGLAHVRLSAGLLKVLLALEVLVAVAFAVVGLTHPAGGHLSWAPLSPAHLTGAGLGGVFALIVASHLGLETTLAFGEEARSHRLLARACLFGVVVLGCLLMFCAWALAAVSGPDRLATISADTVFGTLGRHLGLLVLVLGEVLLVTSILAAMISVHQTVARYVFVLAREDVLPQRLGRVRRGLGVPVGGSLVQSSIGLAVIGVWTLLGADAMVLFSWLAALAAVGLMALMVTACAAAWRFFHHGGGGNESVFTRMIAPVGGMVAMGVLLAVTVSNLYVLVGTSSESGVVWLLPGLVVGASVAGLVWGVVVQRRHPGQVLGRGEPDPLAELSHHLVDVKI
jgi:amino acid transporter